MNSSTQAAQVKRENVRHLQDASIPKVCSKVTSRMQGSSRPNWSFNALKNDVS